MKRTSEALLRFAIQKPGWHTLCNGGKKWFGAMHYLEAAGFLEILRYPNGKRQFRLNSPLNTGDLGEPFDGNAFDTYTGRSAALPADAERSAQDHDR